MTTVVSGQRVLFLERHVTHIAFKRVVFNVPIMVIFQLHLVAERLIAILDGTSKRSLGVMNGFDVLVQTPLFPEFFVTVGTNFRHHIAM